MNLARNALTGAGRYAIGAVMALAVTPYALRVLGAERFGIWALGGVVLTLFRLLDLGLNRALVQNVAACAGRGDPASAASAVATARTAALAIAGAAAVAVWAAAGVVATVLGIPLESPLLAEASLVVAGTAVFAAIEATCAPSQAALDGLGRMDLSNVVDALVQRIASPLGVVVVLGLGWGIPGLIVKNLVTAAAAGALYAWLLHRRSPALGGAWLGWDPAAARQLLGFGRHVQAVSLASALVEPAAKTLLSREAGLAAVAAYEIAARVTGQLSGVLGSLAAALFPAAAARGAAGADATAGESASRGELAKAPPTAREGPAALVELHRTAARYNAWLALPAYALLLVLARPFVDAWLGAGQADVAAAIQWLGAGWAVAILSLPAFHIAQAGGRPRLSTAGGMTTAAVAIAASMLLVGPYGLDGVAAGVGIGLAAGGLAILGLFTYSFRIGLVTLGVLPPGAIVAATAAAAIASWTVARLPAALWAVGVAGGMGVAVAGGMFWAGRTSLPPVTGH